jgi:hypothetical protein
MPSNNQRPIREFTTPRTRTFPRAQGRFLSTKRNSPAEKGPVAAQAQLAGCSLPRDGKPVEPSDHQICCDVGAPGRAAGAAAVTGLNHCRSKTCGAKGCANERRPRASTSVLVRLSAVLPDLDAAEALPRCSCAAPRSCRPARMASTWTQHQRAVLGATSVVNSALGCFSCRRAVKSPEYASESGLKPC